MCSRNSKGIVRNFSLDRVTALLDGAFVVPLGMVEACVLGPDSSLQNANI